jgi:glyoxylase-like metal-dependent hydrolase (beta-lactamase superfamily II)
MHEIAPDVFQVPLSPRNGVNAYLIGDVLVDTGLATSAGRLKKVVQEKGVKTIALTHAHGDHVGSARKLKDEFGLQLWVGTKDRDATEAGKAVKKDPFNAPGLSVIAGVLGDFKAVPVDRVLNEGDELAAGFTVLDTPGHSPGHVSFWRAEDKTLICGDVFFNMHILTTVPGLRQPPGPFTVNPKQNRDSERKLAELRPSVVGFGHGPVLTDRAATKLSDFVGDLPA